MSKISYQGFLRMFAGGDLECFVGDWQHNGLTPINDLAVIMTMANFVQPLNVVEIGIHRGWTAKLLLDKGANIKAVEPSVFVWRFTSSLFSSNSMTTSAWPFWAANIKAVRPALSWVCTSAFSSSSNLATSAWPFKAAIIKTIWPSFFVRMLTSAFSSSSSLATSGWPFKAAIIKAV